MKKCNSNVSQTGSGNFLEEKAILIPLDHISHVFRAI